MSDELKLAEQIVDAVLRDLSGRKGIGDELDLIQEDIKSEMRSELVEIVRAAVKERGEDTKLREKWERSQQ